MQEVRGRGAHLQVQALLAYVYALRRGFVSVGFLHLSYALRALVISVQLARLIMILMASESSARHMVRSSCLPLSVFDEHRTCCAHRTLNY